MMNRMQDDSLGQALHVEGKRSGPAFSRLLHERVMKALGECGMEATPERRRGNWVWKVSVPVGLAAALAIAAGTWSVLHNAKGPEKQQSVADNGLLVIPDDVDDVIGQPTGTAADEDESLDQAQYASLNRDARKLVSFVADQVPSFTSDAQ